ncbi:MAG: phosphatidylserine decarboxylase [Phycisphaerales bacterium]|nr:phosphatidylserine decarboxylase [Phycisphaerales bacterium]
MTVAATPPILASLPGPGVRPVLGIARDGWPIIALFAAMAAAAWSLGSLLPGWWLLAPGVLFTVLLLWCVYFFRDPERTPPPGAGLVISGADGVVCHVGSADPPAELRLPGHEAIGLTRVSVFMDLLSVHVNRAPIAGRVDAVAYKPGSFLNASLDKASDLNERMGMVIRLPDGRPVAVVQVAGLVARRIVCRVKAGMGLAAGERFGMIRFGSRVDVYLPRGFTPAVRVGDKASAGVTVIAREGAT